MSKDILETSYGHPWDFFRFFAPWVHYSRPIEESHRFMQNFFRISRVMDIGNFLKFSNIVKCFRISRKHVKRCIIFCNDENILESFKGYAFLVFMEKLDVFGTFQGRFPKFEVSLSPVRRMCYFSKTHLRQKTRKRQQKL